MSGPAGTAVGTRASTARRLPSRRVSLWWPIWSRFLPPWWSRSGSGDGSASGGGADLDPVAADAFLDTPDKLLAPLRSESAWEVALEAELEPRRHVPSTAIDAVAGAFGDFADPKFPSALGHSAGVARWRNPRRTPSGYRLTKSRRAAEPGWCTILDESACPAVSETRPADSLHWSGSGCDCTRTGLDQIALRREGQLLLGRVPGNRRGRGHAVGGQQLRRDLGSLLAATAGAASRAADRHLGQRSGPR
jgi:hypothetical protein